MLTETREKKLKKFTSKMQGKLLLVFCIIIILMMGIIGRLVYINQTDGDRYAKKVLSQQTYTSTVLPYQRGSITDRKGTVLAVSQKVYNLVIDIKYILEDEKYLQPTTAALTESFKDITADMITELVKKKPESQYTILLKKLSYDQMMSFKKIVEKDENIKGVWFEEDFLRSYPYKDLASHIIGFTSSGNVGNWGIEQYYNDKLNGTNGREYGYIDDELNLERTIKPAVNGNTIVSSIDANVQGIIQNHIKTFNKDIGSKNIGVLVMNPNNGEILAMASNNEYDLNNPTDLSSLYTKSEISKMNEDDKLKALNAIWRNYTISDTFEPGSTFKPVTISSALEEAKITSEDTYFCDGYEEFGGVKIRCSKRAGHGELTITQALMYSCNDVLMQVAAKEGRKIFYNYQNNLGFGKKTGIDLPGEASGILVPEANLNATELATSSFGQTFTTTMIQLASAYSSLINGGNYYEPHVVKQITNDQGVAVESLDDILIRKTISKETSDFIRNSMYLTVSEGTAKAANVPGYTVSGKTGTAQKLPRGSGTYVVSFLGNVPANNPQIVIYVVIDEPQNVIKQADSSIATSFASRILKDILPFLEIYPSQTNDTTATAVNGNTKNESNKQSANGTNNKATGETVAGETVAGETGSTSVNNTTGGTNAGGNNGATSSKNEDDQFNPDFIPSLDNAATKDNIGN